MDSTGGYSILGAENGMDVYRKYDSEIGYIAV